MNASGDSRIAFVQSSWHDTIVDRCRASFAEETAELGLAPGRVDFYRVPGSFELPLHAKRLARTGVAKAVIDGLMRVQLDEDVPVISAVLTPHHFHEHDQHASFFSSHFEVKGKEAARACINTMQSLEVLSVRAG
jgi:6,7-dimethyl-8-ribityllumazine synthase